MARLHLAVQQPQRVAVQAVLAVIAEPVVVACVVDAQPLDVRGTAVAISDAVDHQLDIPEAQAAHQFPGHFDDLGVDGWVRISERFHAELVVLAETSCLRPLVAEHGAEVIHADWLREVVHPVLQVGPAHRRSTLGTERDAVATPVLEGIHLLFDDVRSLSHRSYEEI